MSGRLLTCGEHAVLVELDKLTEVLALNSAVRAAVEAGNSAFAQVVDVVPAARTLLLMVRDGGDLTSVRNALPSLLATALASPPLPSATLAAPAKGRDPTLGPADAIRSLGSDRSDRTDRTDGSQIVEIAVHYDGPDLDRISELTHLTPAQVVAAHTQTPWQVAFCGFAPGFAYLCGGDGHLQVPRRSEPRTSVPAGSVGLAGEFSAIYPRSSPGGWQLLGHTEAILWDIDRDPPALLQPGSVVRFVDVGGAPELAS